MALVKCTKCGNMISDKARRCPKCGANVRVDFIQREDRSKSSSGKWWLLAAAVIIVALLLFKSLSTGGNSSTVGGDKTTENVDSGVIQGMSMPANETQMFPDVHKPKDTTGNKLSEKVKQAHSLWASLSEAGLYSYFKDAQFSFGYYYHNGRVRECSIGILGDYQIHEKLKADIDENGNMVSVGNCNYGEIRLVLFPQRYKDNTVKGEISVGNDKAIPVTLDIEEYID